MKACFSIFGFVLALIVAFDTYAASGKNPEYIWQPSSSEMAVAAEYLQTPEYEQKLETVGSGIIISSKESKSGIRGTFSYGFTDSVSLSIGTTSMDSKSVDSGSETKRTGLGDVEAKFATSWGGSYRLHVGLGANYSPAKRKDAFGGANGNQYSGGLSFIPYVGLSIPIAGASWIGIVGSFESKQERKTEVAAGSDNTTTGGNIAQVLAFWEIPFRSILLDLAGGVRTVDKEKTTSAAGTVSENATYSTTVAQADLKYLFSPSTLIGARYVMLMSPDFLVSNSTFTVKAMNVSEISLLLRFGF